MFIKAKIGLKTSKYRRLIVITLKIAGKISDQIEKPDALKTVSSLFLLSFMYVCMELNKKTVGRIRGNKVGMWKIAIFSNTVNSTSLLELLLINSIKSIEINKRQEKENIIRKEKIFSLIRYLKIIGFLIIDNFPRSNKKK